MSTHIEAKACPRCGKQPRMLTTFSSSHYLKCPAGHVETKACPATAEAIALWNAEQFEEQLPASTPRRSSYFSIQDRPSA